jgi:ABC-type transport system substrate-binding protein
MRRKHVFSLLMSSTGVALLVAATTVAAASSSQRALRGGTLRVDQVGTFDTLDPQLAYVSNDWQVLYSTQLLLVNFPNSTGQAGARLFPEAAKAFPRISKNGTSYTFHLRPGLRFSDGSTVTAAAFQRAFERNLSPKMFAQYGIFDGLNTMVVGAHAFAEGKEAHISGIKARGLTLTVRLTKPNPRFISILAMQWFGAVKPNMPYSNSGSGILKYPSAGPYYIATDRRDHRLVVLKRNPYYHGVRPANPDKIVIRSYPSSNGEASLLRVEKNQVDLDAVLPAADVRAVAQKYGYPSNKHSQFHLGTTTCVFLDAFNNERPPTNDVRVRRAVNYAIGRTAIINLVSPYAGTATDQMLIPGLPGYKKLSVYPNSPDVQKAEQVGGTALENAPPLNISYNPASQRSTALAELQQSEIERTGLTVNLLKLSGGDIPDYRDANISQTGFCGDYYDPFDFINVIFDSRLNNHSYPLRFKDPSFDRLAEHAASLYGKARIRAYAALDRVLMTKYAPVAPLYVGNLPYLTSKRVHNVIYSHVYGGPILNAMSVR